MMSIDQHVHNRNPYQDSDAFCILLKHEFKMTKSKAPNNSIQTENF